MIELWLGGHPFGRGGPQWPSVLREIFASVETFAY